MKNIIISKYLSIASVVIMLSACGGGGSSSEDEPPPGPLLPPPDTKIESTPSLSTNSTSATFSFIATEESASFECSLDNDSFADCSSPMRYENLAEGSHSFSVKATDSAENTDPTAAVYSWNIDTTPPDTNITNTPPPSTNSTSATFSFIATEPESTFECSLDNDSFVDCSSPISYENLAEGRHNFRVRAIDSVGNTDLFSAVYPWTIKPNDPLYSDQWHLKNTGQAGNDNQRGKVGEDINIEPVWNSCIDDSCRGEDIRIAVVDDGLEMRHEDLKENVVPGKSYDYVDQDTTPSPGNHGTSVAGIIAARDLNGLGVRGVAPRAELVGYNFLKALTLENLSDAMTRDAAQNHVSNNSWGPTGGAGRLFDAPSIWRTAIETGHRIGRDGRGTVYVFAAGNGHSRINFLGRSVLAGNSNYNGHANYRGVVAVSAVTHSGRRASYSERGANLLVSAPGGEACETHSIMTTDITGSGGYNSGLSRNDVDNADYTACFGNTSAAAPMVSGVAALILQENPDLGWRDVHAILARSARKNDLSDSDWQTNGAGLQVNHNYGFGVVDAKAAVLLAKNWTNLAPEKKYSTSVKQVNKKIGDNDGLSVVSVLSVESSDISNIEFIDIRFSADDHPYAGDLEITLTNLATGTSSRLAETHFCEGGCILPYRNWRFGSTRHLGENADGNWQLAVEDKGVGDNGTFQSWKLTFYGT
ncbi:MAG: S8 family serine peptidase [Gammaproteobacteria bacterium]|nr:S8 family serine peptidase [Gammaproteobacteria bacterium]